MSNNNIKVFDSLVSRTKIYLVVIAILLIVICILKANLIIPSIIVYILIVAYTSFANNKRKSEISQHLQDLTLTVNSAAKSSLIYSPFPLIIVETDGNIVWRSTKFVSEFANIAINSYVNDLIMDINNEIQNTDGKEKTILRQIQIDNKEYKIIGEFIKSGNKDKRKTNKYMMILYFIDETEQIKLKQEYLESKSCVGIIMVDNYEETMQRVENEEKPRIVAEIEKKIYDWANETEGIIVKTDRDRFVYIFEHKYLEKIKENKFNILDTIKEINIQGKAQLTLSISISSDGDTDRDKYRSAEAAMDVVLGRGGDQATVRENGKYQFFGGRVEEVEKRTKVKARVVAHALEELILEAEKVLIMGHTTPDVDALGSALGVYRLVKSLGKEACIVVDTSGAALKGAIENIEKEVEYNDVIINKEIAEEKMTSETLLIIVDTHKRNYVEVPELIERANKIAIIDHHRRSADFINESVLTFQEVYASSASELVTELLQYVEAKVELTQIEAECLYAGIMMDTKNFTFKTGVRTFEAAAYLRKCGVDIIKVKKWIQSDLETYNKITEIVKRAEIQNGTIAISTYDVEEKDAGIICAKAADELLTIGDITATFVLGNVGDKISISGRSIGDINVQVILEKLGGGGHITLAGAQLEGKTIEEAKQEVIEKIKEYFSEIEN